MKLNKKLLIICGLVIFIPILSKASSLIDIKEIRGDKNYFADLVLFNVEMAYDESMLSKNMYPNDTKPKKENSKSFYSDDRWEGDILEELSGKKFLFCAPAGGRANFLQFIDGNGNFFADYIDYNVDVDNGASCKGRFEVVERIDDTSFKLKLAQVETISKIGEYTIDGKTFCGLEVPCGLSFDNNEPGYNTNYTLYLPKRLKSQIDEDVYWWARWAITDDSYLNDYDSRIFILANDYTKEAFSEYIK